MDLACFIASTARPGGRCVTDSDQSRGSQRRQVANHYARQCFGSQEGWQTCEPDGKDHAAWLSCTPHDHPEWISDRDLESMGGNTMHVHVVGAAMLMVLAMVDWSSAAASGPCHGLPRKAKNAGTTIYQSKMRRGPRSTVHGLKCRKSQVSKVLANLAARWQMPKGKPVIKKSKLTTLAPKKQITAVSALRGTRWG